jgi:hypothetical protein
MANDRDEWLKATGRESFHWEHIPDAYRNIPGIQQWANDESIDPNAKVQEYLASQRTAGNREQGDAALLAKGGGGGGGSQQNNQATPGEQTTQQRSDAGYAQNQQRNTQLWNDLWGRAQQSKNIDRNDPIIRAQADAYAANEQRASRDHIADLAESSGPMANLRGEQRLAAERTGQRTGAFEANLMGQELSARRQEISEALNGMRGMLSLDQQQQLQRELGVMDAQLRRMGYNQNWNMALMQNDQFMKNLGLQAEDKASYWDAVRRGILD